MTSLLPRIQNRIRIAFYGQDRPAYANDTEEGRAMNRRVEFFFYRVNRGMDENQLLQGEFQGRLEFTGQAQGAGVQAQGSVTYPGQ